MNSELGEKPIFIIYKSLTDDKWVACQDCENVNKLIPPELEDLLETLKEKEKIVESLLKKSKNV